MPKPDLQLLTRWLDPALVAELESRRKANNEWRRHRKLATLETLWLMLAVSLDTQRSSLHEILRLATGQLGVLWSISVPAFCKARARFSPERPLLAVRPIDITAANGLQERPESLAWAAPACR